MRKHFIVGTAGHVDHGKTSLIRALTGIDTDRLPEEKARGLSIDLGFAHLSLPGDVQAGIVDVPGHQRFLKNMLAGVGGYDLGMLVVDAQEGVMPQTREHLEILDLLATPLGLVVISKCDVVEAEFLELVQEDLREFLAGTCFAGAPQVVCSSKTGQGLGPLTQHLAQILGKAPVRTSQGPARFPIDRVFLKAGFGTVVTGSLWSGSIRQGDRLQLWPGGKDYKVRGLQVHGQEVEQAQAGQRLALNLSGVETGSLDRGMLLATPGWLQPTLRLDVRLHLSGRVARPLKHNSSVRVYQATAETFARVVLLEGDELQPGETGLAQLVLQEAAVLLEGDRLIVRDATASFCWGGGQVLEPLAQPHRRKDEATLQQLLTLHQGGLQARVLGAWEVPVSRSLAWLSSKLQLERPQLQAVLESLAQQGHLVSLTGGWALTAQVEEAAEALLSLLAGLQQQAHWKWGWRKEELLKQLHWPQPKFAEEVFAWLLEQQRLQLRGRSVHLPGHQAWLTRPQQSAQARVLQRLASEGFSPSPWTQFAQLEAIDGVTWTTVESFVLETGLVVKLSPDIVMSQAVVERGKEILSRISQPFTASQAREALETSRKFAIPLLEHYDQIGFTQRHGEVRQAKGRWSD